MRRSVRAGLVAACLVGLTVTPLQVHAQTPAVVQVGNPGCADDVAVRASREAITFLSRGRAVREHLVPAVAPILSSIDLRARVAVIDPPPGLLEP